ncbi:MAG: diacylglycerol kinase family protein [Candidatus Nomurabacteria bacterium]|jgi:diacylglycerol kinase|nr:diacylglycerol kinase family protein [Candidatus Nomurabacteria bacterium]
MSASKRKSQKTSERERFLASFVNAGNGVQAALAREFNVRVFAVVTVAVIAAGWALGISLTEWMVLIIVIGLNFVAELFNTALEVLCDRVTRKSDAEIRAVKDISAAAVLIFAVTAAFTGGIIFLPRIIALF